MKIKAKVDCNDEEYVTDEIDISPITQEQIINYCTDGYLNIFQSKHRVTDVWRYVVDVANTDINIMPVDKTVELSDFNDRPAADAEGTKNILFILESPHKSEYKHDKKNFTLKPKAPAQGYTGRNIESFIGDILKKIPELSKDNYCLIISNPIPYLCSLGIFTDKLNAKIRDNVWNALWNITDEKGKYIIREEFITRCKHYQPEYIINCCTANLKKNVTSCLLAHGFKHNLYTAHHPSAWKYRTPEELDILKVKVTG
ncbi:hypothetical protein [Candidatus Methylobacter oryzae]|uniref:Uracil-DNA glycosylase-like domain-containing protein n=1 Tax=Candidatus Methylobacter oryzae TaxID=2497749 RepID=A0ABY3CEU5_9GAMM|nr:hypothetical protein [Candidatus Methylobacter oryzae]TRX01467.1 hypothetical protein EKO24_004075 [Candidatus Methylobacter oryzae]